MWPIKEKKIDSHSKTGQNSYTLKLAVRMYRYGSLIKINLSAMYNLATKFDRKCFFCAVYTALLVCMLDTISQQSDSCCF